MHMSYNLRSSQRKKCISERKCYLENLLENQSYESFNPKVCLKRLKLLECNDIHNSRFYLDNDRITIKQGRPNALNKKLFFKLSCFILLLILFLVFCKDGMQFCNDIFAKKFSELYPVIQNFYFQTGSKTCMSSLVYMPQNASNTDAKLEFLVEEKNHTYLNDDFEIKKLVSNYFMELKDKNEYKIFTKTSFIKEQCAINVGDNFDETNLTDYALESLGAEIVTVFDTEPYGIKTLKFLNFTVGPLISSILLKHFQFFNMNGPNLILMPWKKPGDCWAFKGSSGRVQIKLSDKIFITTITIDHIPKKATLDGNIKSAPKKFSVLGMEELGLQSTGKYLGTYEYNSAGPSSQTFLLQPNVAIPFRGIEVRIESNHGNEMYTCVYKIRVHGHQ